MLTRLYLDVDGVLNASNAKLTWGSARSTSMSLPNPGGYTDHFRIVWSPDLIVALDDLRTTFELELVWLTTWNQNKYVLKHLVPTLQGLTDGRVLPYFPQWKPRDEPWGWWKGRGLLRDQASSPTPFIWIDDQEVPEHGHRILTETSDTLSLLIAPTRWPASRLTTSNKWAHGWNSSNDAT